jgi:ketosteroid isomerase-like protein
VSLRSFAACTLVVALAAGTIGAAKSRPGNSAHAAAEAEVRAAMARYDRFVLGMKGDSIAASYLPGGVMVNNGTTIARGPDSIRTFLGAFTGKVRVDHQQTDIDSILVRGDTVFVGGVYHQTATLLADSNTVQVSGRIQAAWVRTRAGWRIRSMATAPLAAPRPAATDTTRR